MKLKVVEIIEHTPDWFNAFNQEAKHLKACLHNYIKAIHHIGSTSIPAMPAKPIIDILLEVTNLDDIQIIKQALLLRGFEKLHRSIIPHQSYITTKTECGMQFNCHIYEMGDSQITRYLRFRDYLIKHPNEALAYAQLKKQLSQYHRHDVFQYVRAKSCFVHMIDKKAKISNEANGNFSYQSFQNTGIAAKNWSNEKIVNAMEANFNVRMTHFMQYISGNNFIRIPGYTLIDSGLSSNLFNYVLDMHFQKNELNVKIEEISRYFYDKKVSFTWWLGPNDKPDNLAQFFGQMTQKKVENYVGIYLDLDVWQPQKNLCNFTITMLEKKIDFLNLIDILPNINDDLKKYLFSVSEIYTQDDPIKFYVGYMNNKLAICSVTVFYAQVAGIYHIFSMDNNQEPYKCYMENFLFENARKLGYHIAVLQVAEEALPTYLDCGFKKLCFFKKIQVCC